MKIKRYVLTLGLCALTLSACGTKEKIDLTGSHQKAETMAAETTKSEDAESAGQADSESGSEGSASTVAAQSGSVTAKIEKETLGDFSVEYPVLENLPDGVSAEEINALLKEKATLIVSAWDITADDTVGEITCEVVFMDRSRFAASYSGYVSGKDSMHPTSVFYTTAVDLKSGKLLRLSDYADPAAVVSYLLSDDCIVLSDEAQSEILENIQQNGEEMLTDMLRNADFTEGGDSMPEVFSYEKQGEIYIGIPTIHALGDYAIVKYIPETK